jgi:hypothetical protein
MASELNGIERVGLEILSQTAAAEVKVAESCCFCRRRITGASCADNALLMAVASRFSHFQDEEARQTFAQKALKREPRALNRIGVWLKQGGVVNVCEECAV